MPHIVITRLVTYPARPDMEIMEPNTAIYGTIDDIPVVVGIPEDVPHTRQDIRQYLLANLVGIRFHYEQNLRLGPIHNLEIAQEFDFEWPPE